MTETDIVGSHKPGLFSIGHSTHRFEDLVALLDKHGVEVVADVRTSPYSRYNPQFNKRDLHCRLKRTGIRYVFFGKELGGRPDGDGFYDRDGHVNYGKVAETHWFQTGLDRLCDGAARFRTALLCSEEDPAACHRLLLITRALDDRGVKVVHIRGDGSVQSTKEISTFDPEHKVVSLFGEEVRSSWRSTRPVSPGDRPKTGSSG